MQKSAAMDTENHGKVPDMGISPEVIEYGKFQIVLKEHSRNGCQEESRHSHTSAGLFHLPEIPT